MRSQGDFHSPWPALGWDPSNQGWGLSRSHLSQRWGTSLQANFTGTLLEHALYPVVPGGPGPWQKAGVGARSGRPARSHRLSKAATLPSRCWARRQQHGARRWWARIRLTNRVLGGCMAYRAPAAEWAACRRAKTWSCRALHTAGWSGDARRWSCHSFTSLPFMPTPWPLSAAGGRGSAPTRRMALTAKW